MIYKKSIGEKIFDVFTYIFLLMLTLLTLYPCLYVLFASVSDPVLLYKGSKILLFPRGFGIGTYKIVFENPMIWISYRNTLIYTFLSTVVSMLLTIMGSYVLSRRYLPGRNIMMIIITFTMFFSGGLIPIYLVVRSLNLLDTIWAMVFPGAINTFNLIIMMSYFRSIPDSMEESARIDGANDFIILFKIMVPLALPVIAVVGLYYIVGNWNSFMPPLMYLNKRELFPLQLILREILIGNDSTANTGIMQTMGVNNSDYQAYAENVRYGTIVVATVPILMVYPFLQKYFVKGIMLGAIKE